MQLTHILDGFGMIDVPHKQHNLQAEQGLLLYGPCIDEYRVLQADNQLTHGRKCADVEQWSVARKTLTPVRPYCQ